MRYNIKILESNSEIEKKILDALVEDCRKFFQKSIRDIKSKLPTIIRTAIQDSPEYKSLVSGDLQYEIGIEDAANKTNGLINIWINSMLIDYKLPTRKSGSIKGSINIRMIKSNFDDVLGTDYAIITDKIRGYSLPWLEWLLLDGTKTIVRNYEVVLGPNPRSRTGYAIMKSNKSESWSVPPEYAGTVADNWITRSIDGAEESISQLLDGIFKV